MEIALASLKLRRSGSSLTLLAMTKNSIPRQALLNMSALLTKLMAISILFFAVSVHAAETFRIFVLGTRHFADVDLITKNIRGMKSVKRYVPSVSNQKHLEFTGALEGDKDVFIEDIKSLSLDRFDVSVKDSQSKGLVVTLRKIR